MAAVIAGLATFVSINIALAFVYGFACAHSQAALVLLRFSPLAWPIKIAGWFGATWAAMSIWAAMS